MDRGTTAGTPAREDVTGHERDAATQLHYAGARYYMSALGRWTATEPLLEEMGAKKLMEQDVRLLSMSPYNYAFDNPTNLTDPDGKCPCLWDIVDFGFAAQSIYTAWNDPSASNVGWVVADVAAAALPVVPSTGYLRTGTKLASKGSKLLRANTAIGMSPDAAKFAVENVGRVDHASRHLIDSGVMQGVSKGSKEARSMFRDLAKGALENPTATFDNTLRGGLEVKGFVGTVGDQQVIIYVAKGGQGKVRQGDVVTAIKPPPEQLDKLLNQ